jgi:hypothetical protein
MMGHREELKSGDEYDALTRGKRYHRFRAGTRQKIKRQFNKRQRREARDDLNQWMAYRYGEMNTTNTRAYWLSVKRLSPGAPSRHLIVDRWFAACEALLIKRSEPATLREERLDRGAPRLPERRWPR